MSRRQHGYPWPSLATSPYHSSPPAGLQGYILCPHIVAVCKFVLVVLLLHIHMWGSTGVHRLWARPCFSKGKYFKQKKKTKQGKKQRKKHQKKSRPVQRNLHKQMFCSWRKKVKHIRTILDLNSPGSGNHPEVTTASSVDVNVIRKIRTLEVVPWLVGCYSISTLQLFLSKTFWFSFLLFFL